MDADELLPDPRRPGLLRTAARRRLLGGLAVAVIAAGIAVQVGRSDGSGSPRPKPTPTRSIVAGPPLAPANDISLFPYDPTVCPNELPCGVTDVVPPAVLVALREHAPGATATELHTVGVFAHQPVRNGLWFRQIDARAGAIVIQVVVKKASPDSGSTPKDTSVVVGERSIGFVRVNIGSFAVSVQFTGPPSYRPPMPAIRAFAADPRLLRLS